MLYAVCVCASLSMCLYSAHLTQRAPNKKRRNSCRADCNPASYQRGPGAAHRRHLPPTLPGEEAWISSRMASQGRLPAGSDRCASSPQTSVEGHRRSELAPGRIRPMCRWPRTRPSRGLLRMQSFVEVRLCSLSCVFCRCLTPPFCQLLRDRLLVAAAPFWHEIL